MAEYDCHDKISVLWCLMGLINENNVSSGYVMHFSQFQELDGVTLLGRVVHTKAVHLYARAGYEDSHSAFRQRLDIRASSRVENVAYHGVSAKAPRSVYDFSIDRLRFHGSYQSSNP